jgi:hypothetical protein
VSLPPKTVSVLSHHRVTVDINAHLQASGVTAPVNVSVAVTSQFPLVAERPLYFHTDLAGGVDGGTDVMGAPV